MSDVTDEARSPQRISRKGAFLLVLAVVVMGAGGFLSTYVAGLKLPFSRTISESASRHPETNFYDFPQLVISLPDSRARMLVMSIKIEANTQQDEHIERLLPRILDSFNVFLADINPTAFERRGILEIIRNELATRLSYVLGPDGFDDLLITEFRIQ